MDDEKYEYVKAYIDCGTLRWEYRVVGRDVPGGMSHDEDVDGWSDEEIRELTRTMLDVPEDVHIEVLYC